MRRQRESTLAPLRALLPRRQRSLTPDGWHRPRPCHREARRTVPRRCYHRDQPPRRRLALRLLAEEVRLADSDPDRVTDKKMSQGRCLWDISIFTDFGTSVKPLIVFVYYNPLYIFHIQIARIITVINTNSRVSHCFVRNLYKVFFPLYPSQ